jgi:3-phenylpropionate/trans-cinnamate dioxygenase ferredoxin subunit
MSEYLNLGKVSDFPEGQVRPFTLDDEKIAVVQSEGRFYAFSNECTHTGAELTSAYTYGSQVVCWLHGSVFDMDSGARLDGPAYDPLTVYDVRVEGDAVLIGRKG